ncbi:hypothetical protein K2X30_12695 [bacterium]|nr:hypothetical protein [bacterium]
MALPRVISKTIPLVVGLFLFQNLFIAPATPVQADERDGFIREYKQCTHRKGYSDPECLRLRKRLGFPIPYVTSDWDAYKHCAKKLGQDHIDCLKLLQIYIEDNNLTAEEAAWAIEQAS